MTSKKAQQERLAEIGRGQAYLMHEMRRPLVTIGLLTRFLRKRSDLKRKDGETLDTIIELVNSGEKLLTFTGYEAPERVVIKIKDTGPGIDPEVRDEMFRPFVSTKKGGSGLGLALAKRIVEDHDGKLSVRSKPGWGTSVTMWLPRLTS